MLRNLLAVHLRLHNLITGQFIYAVLDRNESIRRYLNPTHSRSAYVQHRFSADVAGDDELSVAISEKSSPQRDVLSGCIGRPPSDRLFKRRRHAQGHPAQAYCIVGAAFLASCRLLNNQNAPQSVEFVERLLAGIHLRSVSNWHC
jgi:hypothetical protein